MLSKLRLHPFVRARLPALCVFRRRISMLPADSSNPGNGYKCAAFGMSSLHPGEKFIGKAQTIPTTLPWKHPMPFSHFQLPRRFHCDCDVSLPLSLPPPLLPPLRPHAESRELRWGGSMFALMETTCSGIRMDRRGGGGVALCKWAQVFVRIFISRIF